MTLGEKIRALRKRRYSQEELAEIIGVHVNTIVRWERGDRNPTADKLKRLADALCTTPSELLSSEEIEPMELLVPRVKREVKKETVPYTREQENKGMLVYVLSNGERIELPPSQASYDFLRDMAMHSARSMVSVG